MHGSGSGAVQLVTLAFVCPSLVHQASSNCEYPFTGPVSSWQVLVHDVPIVLTQHPLLRQTLPLPQEPQSTVPPQPSATGPHSAE